jgi:hypothetical protein
MCYRTKVGFGFKHSRENECGQVTFFSRAYIYPTPGRDPFGCRRVAAGEQNSKLVSLKRLGCR